jgi:hypothetical protein
MEAVIPAGAGFILLARPSHVPEGLGLPDPFIAAGSQTPRAFERAILG